MKHDRRFWIGTVCLVLGVVCAVAADHTRGDETPRKPGASVSDAKALAGQIDRLLESKWAEAKVQPARAADDAEYVRRIYLDLVGMIPTAAEAREFLDDTCDDKRTALVESLLDSPAYLTHATLSFRSLLLPEADTGGGGLGAAVGTFEAWLRRKVSEEAGYDLIVREVLTVRLGGQGRRGGNTHDPRAEPSPLAYYLAKDAKPENLAAGTARTFLGIRLECAQCHNHPFDHWKREEFWGLAAFFAGVSKQGKDDDFGPIREVANRREVAIPETRTIVKAGFLDGSKPKWERQASGRELLAGWVTAPENPYFARAAVNRVWARFFGTGIVEPVDDLRPDNPPSHPELLDLLAREFRSHGYELKFLIRAITATKAYALTSAVGRSEPAPANLFAAMPVRTLSSEQLFETLAQATGFREASPGNSVYEGSSKARFVELFTNRDEKPTEGETSILQALALMNGPLMADVTSPESNGTLAALAEAPYLDTHGRIETLFLAALTRRPLPAELERLTLYVERGGTAGDRTKALADVFWALLNSPEFRFNH
jgi:hypothetical protein